MKRITAERAREICTNWHGGQWSSLYQFASSKTFELANTLRYFQEIETSLHPEYALYPGELTKKEERELLSLKRYFLQEAKNRGIDIVFHPHEVYGYLIPYVEDNTPEAVEMLITPVCYLK
jgi:hypothetical protein